MELVAFFLFIVPTSLYLIWLSIHSNGVTKNKLILAGTFVPSLYFMMKIFFFRHGEPIERLHFYGIGFIISIFIFCLVGLYLLKR